MNNIILNINKPIVLIDSSYYVFYRYFATFKWFKMQKREINDDYNNFFEYYSKHIDADIKKIQKKFKTDINNVIFCLDCPRSKIWRNDIYTGYKITRQQNQNFNQNAFNVFINYINSKNYNIASLDRLEADDIVYLIHERIKNNNIIIITNDNDYLQLVSENTTILNMQFKNIKERTKCINGISNLYYKSLLGDKSDNIPKISTIINKDIALEKCELCEIDLINWLKENNLYEKFLFNLKLISFEYIPNEYKKKFNTEYDFIIK